MVLLSWRVYCILFSTRCICGCGLLCCCCLRSPEALRTWLKHFIYDLFTVTFYVHSLCTGFCVIVLSLEFLLNNKYFLYKVFALKFRSKQWQSLYLKHIIKQKECLKKYSVNFPQVEATRSAYCMRNMFMFQRSKYFNIKSYLPNV